MDAKKDAVDPLPLVPAMWMTGVASWGSPKAAAKFRILACIAYRATWKVAEYIELQGSSYG